MRIKAVLLFLTLSHLSSSQDSATTIFKLAGQIRFDGSLSDSAWSQATPFNFTRQSPDYGQAPSEKTIIKLMYDEHYLYVGTWLFYKNPTQIQDYSKQRDGDGPMDWMAFAFDGYQDKTNGLAFATTPAGLRWDGALSFGSGGIGINSNWNTYWEVKTSRDSLGWYGEFRIPVTSLRFKNLNGGTTMNFIAWRKITYNNEFSVFPDVQPNWGILSFANIAQGKPIRFESIKRKNPVYVTPYVLGGLSNNQQLDGTRYKNNSNTEFQAGLDVKYGISPTLTFDATINTDFAQVEADNFQVNLTRSSLFFPEKREFFLERTNNFSFRFDNNNDAFYSRRIGLENNTLTKIYGGGRLVGRINKWDIGLLNMQTEDKVNDGSKNLGLIRLKRQIGKGNSYIGGIFTSSLSSTNKNYYTYGLDGLAILPYESFLKVAGAISSQPLQINKGVSAENMRQHIRLERIAQRGFQYSLNYSSIGTKYNPEIGFEERPNIKSYETKLGYVFLHTKSKNIFKQQYGYGFYQINGFETNTKESSGMEINYTLEWKNGANIQARLYSRDEILTAPIALSTVTLIPTGSYTFQGIRGFYSTATGKPWNITLSTDVGGFYNGNIFSNTLTGRWDKSKFIQLQASYRMDKINFPSPIPNFTNHLVSLTSIMSFTTKLSINGLIQYDYLNKRIGSNIRFRYNAKEGNDLFIVLTNINNTERYREAIALPALQSLFIAIKYKHTFLLK